jgi:hypothetical protein
MRSSELYISKAKRDARAKQLKAEGHLVRRGTVRNQQLHPQYIEDFEGALETGFGNTQYQMSWSVLYEVYIS